VRVAPNGSGTACTAAAPCSQSTGYAKLASGDTLFFTSGTYRQSATFTVGKSAVTLTADPVQPPAVLTGDTDDDGIAEVPAQGSWSSLVRITSDDVVFENLEVGYSGGRGVTSQGNNDTIRNCNIHNVWRDCIHVFGTYDTIESNRVWRCDDSRVIPG
jgi:hypothetical protein